MNAIDEQFRTVATTSREAAPDPWVRRVIVGTDWSEPAADAVAWAADFAHLHRAELVLMAVAPLPPGSVTSVVMLQTGRTEPWMAEQVNARNTERLIEAAEAMLDRRPDLLVSTVSGVGTVSTELVAAADQPGDVLVVGSRGQSGKIRRLLGSVADAVVTHAHAPVVVVPRAAGLTGVVRVGVDGPTSAAALRFAASETLARGTGLQAVAVAGQEFDAFGDPLSHEALRSKWAFELEHDLCPVREALPDLDIETHVVLGAAHDVLVGGLPDDALLVVGSRGRGGVTGALLGSTSREVVGACTVPVAVVKHDA